MTSYGIEWLAEQADPRMADIWTPGYNLWLERRLWVAVMEAQIEAGLEIPAWAVDASEHASNAWSFDDRIVLDRINQRELITRHDVKARLEIFCEDAGHEYHHLGMTSADIVDNVMQIKIQRSMKLLLDGIPESWYERLAIESWLRRYLFRGIKGAVGTQQDQLDLLGDSEACKTLDATVAARFGFTGVMGAVGQVYPRSQDLDALTQVATTISGKVDRAWFACVAGFQQMAASYSGGQWNEGDVSTSVIRRVCIPGTFLAASAGLRGLS